MGCNVFANGNEIACKAGDGKVIAAFPDVCLSPPSPPAGPIPVPYPNTSFSKDMQSGSKTVKIKGNEIMLKDQSFYMTAPLGDEAATKTLGANIVTHGITGKTFFKSWSMDVKFEGQNVDRHIDLTTSNHASDPPGVAAPIPNAATATITRDPECGEIENDIDSAINRNKHNPQDGSAPEDGMHGLRHRFGEQIYGKYGPGMVAPDGKVPWDTHDEHIRNQQAFLRKKLKRHQEKGCGPPPPQSTDWVERQPPQPHQWRGPGYDIFGPPI